MASPAAAEEEPSAAAAEQSPSYEVQVKERENPFDRTTEVAITT